MGSLSGGAFRASRNICLMNVESRCYKTRALTYYADLNSLLTTEDVSLIDSTVVDCLENYIHQRALFRSPRLSGVSMI
jgi:hypothetical protein